MQRSHGILFRPIYSAWEAVFEQAAVTGRLLEGQSVEARYLVETASSPSVTHSLRTRILSVTQVRLKDPPEVVIYT